MGRSTPSAQSRTDSIYHFIFDRALHVLVYILETLLLIMSKMNNKGVTSWLLWALIFLLIAILSGIFGFGLISGISFTIAKWLAIIFVVLFIISVIAHTIKRA